MTYKELTSSTYSEASLALKGGTAHPLSLHQSCCRDSSSCHGICPLLPSLLSALREVRCCSYWPE